MSDKFLESLTFFDRDHIPKHKVRRLEKVLIENSKFEAIKNISKAAVPLCTWLTALLDYHKVTMTIEPPKKEQKTAEETLTHVSSFALFR